MEHDNRNRLKGLGRRHSVEEDVNNEEDALQGRKRSKPNSKGLATARSGGGVRDFGGYDRGDTRTPESARDAAKRRHKTAVSRELTKNDGSAPAMPEVQRSAVTFGHTRSHDHLPRNLQQAYRPDSHRVPVSHERGASTLVKQNRLSQKSRNLSKEPYSGTTSGEQKQKRPRLQGLGPSAKMMDAESALDSSIDIAIVSDAAPLPESSRSGAEPASHTDSSSSHVKHDKPSKLKFEDELPLSPNVDVAPNMREKWAEKVRESSQQSSSEKLSTTSNLPSVNTPTQTLAHEPPDSKQLKAERHQVIADKKSAMAESRLARTEVKLGKATSKLPKMHSLKQDKTTDLESAAPAIKRRLHFEPEIKNQSSHIKEPAPVRPVKLGANAAIAYSHKKLYQVEHENVGTQAAHKNELIVEGGLRRAHSSYKTKPYRRVAKLEGKSAKLRARAAYRKAVSENPRLQISLSRRMWQKRKIKRQHAKAAREARRSGSFIKRSANMVGKAATASVKLFAKNPKVIIIIAVIILVFMLIASFVASISNIAVGIGQAMSIASYQAESSSIDDASIAYSEWEAELAEQLKNIQQNFPGFDEYRINANAIGHDPWELIAFLTVTQQDFIYPNVRTVLREIFDLQYELTITPSVETRYFQNENGQWVPYEWHVLTITLTNNNFTDILNSRMNDEQRSHFDLLMQTRGNRQYVGSPFPFNWLPNISSHYGWRIHPISGNREFHTGVDIALPTGTEIFAAHSGTVTFSGVRGGYGNLVIIQSDNGIETRYAHCDRLLVSTGQWVDAGDVIATVGSTGQSTGPHLHFEVIIGGRRLNPVFFAMLQGS